MLSPSCLARRKRVRGLGLLGVEECLLRDTGAGPVVYAAGLLSGAERRAGASGCSVVFLGYSGKASCAATGNLGLVRRILGW